MRDRAFAALRCPHCHGPLALAERTLTCGSRHSFDIARHGHVALLSRPLGGIVGDSADMLDARERFFAGGHYQPLIDSVTGAVGGGADPAGPGLVLDLGAGSGHYLAAVLDAAPNAAGVGLDVAKPAVRRLARAHPRAVAVLADLWRDIPVRDSAADVVLSVFAPRNAAETARVLAPGGLLVTLTPGAGHLAPLTALPGVVGVEAGKLDRLDASLADGFTLRDRRAVTYTMPLDPGSAVDVLLMGPTARHLDAEGVRALLAPLGDPVPVAVAAVLSVYRRNG